MYDRMQRMYDRMQRTKHISSNSLHCLKFIFKLNRYLIEDTSNVINFLCTQIVSLNKKYLKNVVNFLSEQILRSSCHFRYIRWYHAELDSIESKVCKPEPPEIKWKAPKII